MGQVLTEEYVMGMNEFQENYIKYGRFLEKNGISGRGDIEDYERYLCEDNEDQEDEKFKELCIQHNRDIPQKEREYEEFLNFIVENGKDGYDNDIAIYDKGDYDSGYFDRAVYRKADDIYDVIGIDVWEFEKCFVSTTYIKNLDIYRVVVKLDNVNKEFVIHGV